MWVKQQVWIKDNTQISGGLAGGKADAIIR